MNEHPISQVVDSVEQALENAHRGLAVARDVRFASEGGLLALRALDVATKTLRAAMKGETIDEPVDKPESDETEDETKGAIEPTRVLCTDPVAYCVRVLRHAREQGLSTRDLAELVGISGETIRRYAYPGRKSPVGTNKRPKTAQRIVDAVVAFTGYNRGKAAS